MTEEKISVIPSVAEESRGNEFFLLPRDGDFLLLGFFSARVKQCRFTATLSRDEQAALRLLNMTEEKISVIPSVAEESRGNERGGLFTKSSQTKKLG